MSIIKLPLHYEGSQGEKVLYTLFDFGATFSCIHPSAIEGLEVPSKLYRPLESVTRMHEVSVCDARFKREPLASESQPRTSVGRSQTRSTAA